MTTAETSEVSRRPMRADARRNYDRLIAAATTAFDKQGANASLDDIARQAGVGPGTLYRHFPTREALLAAVYLNRLDALRSDAVQLAATQPPEEAFLRWIKKFASYIATNRGLIMTVKGALGKDSELLTRCRDTIREGADIVLRGAQQTGAIRKDIAAADLLMLTHSIASVAEYSTDPSQQADRLLNLLLEGLRQPTD